MDVGESRNPRASPSGHLEHGESICQAAVRETFEETGIMLGPATLRHVLSIHQRNRGTSDTRVGFAFAPSARTGEPVNTEPHKHSELVWAVPTALPADTAGPSLFRSAGAAERRYTSPSSANFDAHWPDQRTSGRSAR
jgi:8-oxo-dGTP pyrophosphatase MutT (NUDIX family)